MSAPDDDATPGLVPYRVGYAKPPEDSKFKKGRSGNPNGRPQKPKAKKPDWDPVLRPTDSLILEEAYRPVTIREGDKTIELPAIQASMRALAISAMKGSRLSQKQLSDIVRTVEARKNAERLEVLEVMIEYKQKWTNELERRERLAITAPDPVPQAAILLWLALTSNPSTYAKIVKIRVILNLSDSLTYRHAFPKWHSN